MLRFHCSFALKIYIQPSFLLTDCGLNANWITGFDGTKGYIAMQSPLSANVPDFWTTVFENDLALIVMITKISEVSSLAGSLSLDLLFSRSYLD